MLLRDIIALMREAARNAHVVDDERIDDRIWQDFIMLKREQYIRNNYNKRYRFEKNTVQSENLVFEPYNSALDLTDIDLGNNVIRSQEIARIIDTEKGPAILEVSSPDYYSKTVQHVDFDRLRWVGNGRGNRNFVFASLYDNRLYLKSGAFMHKPVSRGIIKAIFAEPLHVTTFNPREQEYPVNGYMIEYIKNALYNIDLRVLLSMAADEINDSSGRIVSNPPNATPDGQEGEREV